MAYPDPTQPIVINVSTTVTPQADTRLRTFAVVSLGDTSMGAGESKFVSASDFSQTVTGSTSVTYKFLQTFFNQTNNANKQCLVIELTSSGGAQAQLTALQNYIGAGVNTAYGYYLPATLFASSELPNFLANYNGLDDSSYFFVDLESGKLPSASTNWTTYVNGAKCVFGTYPNMSGSNVIASAVAMGIMSSTWYDITSANTLSDLNRKRISGVTPVAMTSTQQNGVVQAPASFFAQEGSYSYLYGARMADGEFWTTRYAWDLTISRITSAIQTAFINSSNIPNSALTFDNRGITLLGQVITNELNTCKDLGLIQSFTLDAIDAQTWEAQNPTEYANGVYGGFTATIKTQRFIQQVIFNVTQQ